MIIMNKTVDMNGDTTEFTRRLPEPTGGRNYIFDLLYGVDSLQDSLKVEEISVAYKSALKKQKIEIPFTVNRIDSYRKTKIVL